MLGEHIWDKGVRNVGIKSHDRLPFIALGFDESNIDLAVIWKLTC